MASREIASDILIHGSLEQVWEALVAFDAYPRWNPFIVKLRATPQVGSSLHATVRLPSGVPMWFRGLVSVVDRPNRLAWTASPVPLPASFIEIEHSITLSDHGMGEVHLHQVERVDGRLVPLSGWLLRQARAGQEAMNVALENLVERA